MKFTDLRLRQVVGPDGTTIQFSLALDGTIVKNVRAVTIVCPADGPSVATIEVLCGGLDLALPVAAGSM